MTLALAARPPPPSVAGVPVSDLIVIGVVGGIVVVVIACVFLSSFVKDRRAHEGVSWFKRRRVLRSGIAAEATVLSSSRLDEQASDLEDMAYFSNVYEIPAPPGGESFRVRGIEQMPTDPPSGYAGSALYLEPGEKAAVKYDPVDRIVVMVNPFQKLQRLQQEAAERRQVVERVRKANEIAQKEKEARLLRGDRD